MHILTATTTMKSADWATPRPTANKPTLVPAFQAMTRSMITRVRYKTQGMLDLERPQPLSLWAGTSTTQPS